MKAIRRLILAALLSLCLLPGAAHALPSLPSSRFSASVGCGCHAGLITDWQPSMHSKALVDPLYRYKLGQADRATKGALDPFCDACHSPIGVMSGELRGLDYSKASSAAGEGVTCDFCHQVQGTGPRIGNTSQVIGPNTAKRAQLTDPHAPHPTAYSAFHKSAAFCGACHDVYHPTVPSLLLEGTYTEWKRSSYAKRGIVCQNCHMAPNPGMPQRKAAAQGPERKGLFSMTFVGANVGLGNSDIAEQNLKAAAKTALTVPATAKSGTKVPVTVTVTNVGAGHYLPTGLTEMRQMWLEITAQEDGGAQLVSKRRDFGTVLRDAKGHHPVELWDAVAIQSDDRIPPQQSVSENVTFAMGDKPVTVTATLYYRSASQAAATGAGVTLPTTQMSTASSRVEPPVGRSSRSAINSTPASKAPGAPTSNRSVTWVIVAIVLLGVLAAGGTFWLLRRAHKAS